MALLAVADGELVGVASYVPLRDQQPSGKAEVAFAVADHMHHRGIATLLLEHLVSLARSRQIVTFTADTLTENKAMLQVFAAAGLPVERRYADGVYKLTFPLPSRDLDSYLDVVAERERRADVASLRHIFAPESVAVIGASRRRGTVGRAILDNIRAGGYGGRLYTVNPRARQIGGERCLASPLDLPEPADLAVIALPAAKVLDVAEQCGQRGVRSLVVVTSGLDAAQSADLLAVCRRHGMRLVGPDCFGVAVPGIGLDATFAARPARPGVTGLVMQSGGLGFALVDHLSRLGIGISSFASTGDKLDVSGNDMLLWWERDGLTRLAVLYIESFGNPRKFARTARRVSCTMPVLTVQAEPAAPPRPCSSRPASSPRTASASWSRPPRCWPPSPSRPGAPWRSCPTSAAPARWPRTPAPASACPSITRTARPGGGCGRSSPKARSPARSTPRPRSPPKPSASAWSLLAGDDEVDAVLAIVLPTGATGDLEAAIQQADVPKPLAAVVLTQPESVRLLNNRVPAYGSPEAAVRALARAAGYGAWRAAPRGQVPALPDVRTEDARALVRGSAPGWLGPAQAAELLRCYGIPLADLAPPGPQVKVRVAGDRVFGPLVTVEAGDSSRTARFTPLTDVDAAYLTRSHPDLDVLHDLLLRVSRLADDLPEVTELDLDLGGAAVISARVKVEPYQPQDPFLRKLR